MLSDGIGSPQTPHLGYTFADRLAVREHELQPQNCERRSGDSIHPSLDVSVGLMGPPGREEARQRDMPRSSINDNDGDGSALDPHG